jgi:hypothetical protein
MTRRKNAPAALVRHFDPHGVEAFLPVLDQVLAIHARFSAETRP